MAEPRLSSGRGAFPAHGPGSTGDAPLRALSGSFSLCPDTGKDDALPAQKSLSSGRETLPPKPAVLRENLLLAPG